MPLSAPIVRYKNLQRTGNLRTYFRGNLDPNVTSEIDLGNPRNTFTQENLTITSVTGNEPWMDSIRVAFTAQDPNLGGRGEGNLSGSFFFPPASTSRPILSSKIKGFSFCMRVNFTDFGLGTEQILFRNGDYDTDGYALVSMLNNGDGNYYFNFRAVIGGSPQYYRIETILELNKWYTICVTVTDGEQLFVYINGVTQTITPPLGGTLIMPTSNTTWLNRGAGSLNGDCFIGQFAEFIFYDSVLPESLFTNSFPTAPFG